MTYEERLVYLILGNVGDETALKNICEVHGVDTEEISEEEKEFFIHTNQFYYNIENFMDLHELTKEDFEELMREGHIVKSSDGFVWINVV